MTTKNLLLAASLILAAGAIASTGCEDRKKQPEKATPPTNVPTTETKTTQTSHDKKDQPTPAIPPAPVIKNITTKEAESLITENGDHQNFVIIDVRTPREFDNEHIENSINLDYFNKNFKNDLSKLDKNKTYLIYCRSGNRSGKSLIIMEEINFNQVYNMLGGIKQWKSEGKPTIK